MGGRREGKWGGREGKWEGRRVGGINGEGGPGGRVRESVWERVCGSERECVGERERVCRRESVWERECV